MSEPTFAIYLPSLNGGGAERVMVTLANGFARHGLKVDLVLANADGPYLAELSPEVRVVDIGAKRVVSSLPGLVRYLRREQPAAMLSAMSHANVAALLARRIAGSSTRLVASERAHLSAAHAVEPTRRGRWMPWLMRRTYPWADAIVAVSVAAADDLARAIHLKRESISVIYNPVVSESLLTAAQAPLDHPWFAPGEPPVVLGVGRLTAQKDFVTLLRAFAQLRRTRAARLMILGDGELRTPLETLAFELGIAVDVEMPGFQENPYKYMRRASLFVLSSRFEGLPNALIQAMACGTPVVSTDCPSGPAEILENGCWGRLVPVGDADALTQAMRAALTEENPPNVSRRARDFGVTQGINAYLRILMKYQRNT